MPKNPLVSVIIPVYNEEKYILDCLHSLAKQYYSPLEVIVVDDGSKDNSKRIAESGERIVKNLVTLAQEHRGPGAARNLGASKANGEILVFVDADMEFEPDFIEKLTLPIREEKTIGTFSSEEYLLNKDNVWAQCWNLNLGRTADKMHAADYPATQHVFRAISKGRFLEAGGFDGSIGYTDDWSLARKLGIMAVDVKGAKFYHRNPESLVEVWQQARWFGKNEFLTRNFIRKVYNLYRYCPVLALFKGLFGAFSFKENNFLVFKVVYDTAVFTSVILSFVGEEKYK